MYQLNSLISATTLQFPTILHVQQQIDGNPAWIDRKVTLEQFYSVFQPRRAALDVVGKTGEYTYESPFDISGVNAEYIVVTGFGFIGGFGSLPAGEVRHVQLGTGGNSTLYGGDGSIIIPNGDETIVGNPGDVVTILSVSPGVWRIIGYFRKNGDTVAGSFLVRNKFAELAPMDRNAAHVNLGLRIGTDAYEGDVMFYHANLGVFSQLDTQPFMRVFISDTTEADARATLGVAIDTDVLAFFPHATKEEMRQGLVFQRRTMSPLLVGQAIAGLSISGLPNGSESYRFDDANGFQLFNSETDCFHSILIGGIAGEEVQEIGEALDNSIPDGVRSRFVANKCRFTDDGKFQIYNPTTGHFHTTFISGNEGEETWNIDAADADSLPVIGYALIEVPGNYRFKRDGSFQLFNRTSGKWHTVTLSGGFGEVTYEVGTGE